MRRMGGLWRRIPITYWTMLIGALAISGIPPLAGFFSKDEILSEAFKGGFLVVWAIGFVVAGMTAFYMFRLIGMTFWGPSHVDPRVEPNIHESPPSMTVPLVLLAIPSVLLGLVIGVPIGAGLINTWLEPVFAETIALTGGEPAPFGSLDVALILASVAIATVGIIVAWRLFGVELAGLRRAPRPKEVTAIANANGLTRFLYRASLNKWWFDDLNDLLFIRIGGRVAAACWWFDRTIIDGVVNELGAIAIATGRGLRRIQTGRVQNYALGIALGLIVMAGSYLVIVAR
jgi:NADH-quinone oxidoreductase subunit L